MHHRHRLLSAASAALLVVSAGASAALAQDRPAPPPGQAGPTADAMRERMAQRHAERLQKLHDLLQLRANQEAAWREFQAAMQPPAGGPKMMDRSAMSQMTTPQRLDLMAQRMNERQARFTAMAAATKRFYAVLTPEQQKAFDAAAGQFMGGRKGMGGRMHGSHHGMMGPRS